MDAVRTWAPIIAVCLAAGACGQTATNKAPAANASAAAATNAAAPASAAAPAAANLAATPAYGPAPSPPDTGITPTTAPAGAPTPPFSERFSTYPVAVFQGPVVYPDFAGAQKPYAYLRTRLTAAVKGGVNFAGHFALVQFVCGLGCNNGFLVDVTNGQVTALPLGGLSNAGIEYASRPDSTLLQTIWRSDLLTDANGNPVNSDPNPTCVFENLLWQGGAFKVLDATKMPGVMCPG